MRAITPADGPVYLAWVNTFEPITAETYQRHCVDKTRRAADCNRVVPVPTDNPTEPVEWLTVFPERVFVDPPSVQRYVVALNTQAVTQGLISADVSAPRVEVKPKKHPNPREMECEAGVLYLPTLEAAHLNTADDLRIGEDFIRSSWLFVQRGWPIAEHNIVHAMVSHWLRNATHGPDFADLLGKTLELTSKGRNHTARVWRGQLEFLRSMGDIGLGALYDPTSSVDVSLAWPETPVSA